MFRTLLALMVLAATLKAAALIGETHKSLKVSGDLNPISAHANMGKLWEIK